MDTVRIRKLASEETLFRLTVLIMLIMPVSEILTGIVSHFSKLIVPSFFQPVILGIYGAAGTLFALFYKSVELTEQTAVKRFYAADVFYLILIFFMIVSAVFSTNPGVYSDGIVLICENPLHFLAYYFLFFSGSRIRSDGYRRKLVIAFLGIAAVQGIIAFFRTFNIEIAYCLLLRHDRAAYGLTQNSNFYGGLSVFLLACCSGAYLFCESFTVNKAVRCILPALSGLVFYTMMGSRARLAWLGFFVMSAFYLVSGLIMLKGNIEKGALKRYFIRFAVLCAVFMVVFAITHAATNFVTEEVQRTQMEIDGKLNNGLGSDRLVNWKFGIESIPRHWLTGIGLDNYRQVFFENPKYIQGTYFQDKAHNEYIHVIATQGVFAFAAYLTLLVRTIAVAVKSIFKGESETEQALTWIFLGMFVTYAAQATANTSVINVAMYFWIVLGLLNNSDRPISLFNKKI